MFAVDAPSIFLNIYVTIFKFRTERMKERKKQFEATLESVDKTGHLSSGVSLFVRQNKNTLEPAFPLVHVKCVQPIWPIYLFKLEINDYSALNIMWIFILYCTFLS